MAGGRATAGTGSLMLATWLALAAAVCYGLSDFAGGLLSKTRPVWMVATASQLTAAVATAAVALLVPGYPGTADFAWGACDGIAGAIGVSALYRGLSQGRMAVVAPISGTGAAVVPVLVGLATGDRPPLLAWAGIAIAFPAIYFIPQAGSAHRPEGGGSPTPMMTGAGYGIIAGLGFGALFSCVAQISHGAGFLPVALAQAVSAVTVAVIAASLHQPWVPRGHGLTAVFAFGLLGTAALILFLIATRHGLLAIVAVITSLYPASTVVMATIILREKIGRLQAAGLGLAVIAVVLVTLGGQH
jgi:drug/metabolite transporter (DMT)-like permease